MIVSTATGARSVYYVGPHPSKCGGSIVYNYYDDGEGISTPLKKKAVVDVFMCPHCKTVVPSKVIRHTPKKAFACLRCIVKFGDKCYIALN